MKSGEIDRKNIIIKRILRYLKDGTYEKPTVYKKCVVNENPLVNLTKTSKIYWGQFSSTDERILALLRKLTDDKFVNGSNSFILIRSFWANGFAPSYEEYARAYVKMLDKKIDHPEWAYLKDLRDGVDMEDWKKMRRGIANKILRLLGVKKK